MSLPVGKVKHLTGNAAFRRGIPESRPGKSEACLSESEVIESACTVWYYCNSARVWTPPARIEARTRRCVANIRLLSSESSYVQHIVVISRFCGGAFADLRTMSPRIVQDNDKGNHASAQRTREEVNKTNLFHTKFLALLDYKSMVMVLQRDQACKL